MNLSFPLILLSCCAMSAGQSAPAGSSAPAQSSPTLQELDNSSNSTPSATSLADRTQTIRNQPKTLKESGAPSKSDGTKASDSDENTDETSPPSSRLAVRPFARSDFELFAEDAAGHPLEVYGRRLFDEVPTTFAPMDRIPVPADYALGPGDQLRVRVWGKVELEFVTTIDRNGQISVPKVGSLAVAGLRYEELEGFLRKAIGNLYTGFEINVSLGRLRSIQIFVLGSARQPGAYTVSSLSTLVDALFASGGPSATGTMRRIQLRRSDHPTAELDVYDLLRKGDKSHDVQLLPGDVIYIPQVGPQVAIVANVNEPGIYELKGETTIASVLEAAGGLTNLAGMDRALLERVENRRRRRVDEFPLDALGLQRPLQDGDLLRIFGISPQFANAVTLRGNVAAPGRFMWHQGMRISDLIPSREFLVTAEHWSQQNHRGERRHNEMMNDIAVTDSEINWDYAAIERLDDRDLSTRLIPFNLAKAIDSPASVDNHELEVGDVVTVFSRKDLPLPIEKRATFVRIGGEVNAPGVYRVHPGETLRNVIARAGGLTPHSYLYASQLTRESTRRIQEEQLKLSIDRMRKDLESRVANGTGALGGSIASPQGASQIALNEQTQLNAQRALIDQLGGVRVTGRVVLGLKPDDRTLNDIPEFPLEDGDSFYIPPELGTVQVTGEVYNANAFRYEVKKRLALYLRNSGGPTRTADQKRIFVIRADGTVLSRQSQDHLWSGNFDRLILMPGDAVVVPPKLKNSSGFMTQLPILTQILSQTAMTGAVVSLIQ